MTQWGVVIFFLYTELYAFESVYLVLCVVVCLRLLGICLLIYTPQGYLTELDHCLLGLSVQVCCLEWGCSLLCYERSMDEAVEVLQVFQKQVTFSSNCMSVNADRFIKKQHIQGKAYCMTEQCVLHHLTKWISVCNVPFYCCFNINSMLCTEHRHQMNGVMALK